MSDKIIPLPVKGYTGQTSEVIELVNHLKVQEEILLRAIDQLKTTDEFDQRWIAIGTTHIQQGFMAIIRGVFKPQRLEDLDLD